MTAVRRGEVADLPEIRAIQAASPSAAQWDVTDYLRYELFVSVHGTRITGFLVTRTLSPGECEILNLAVAAEFRRQGFARHLLSVLLETFTGSIFLEVRSSNTVARLFYKSMGFQEVTTRPEYYQNPLEPAIVMKFHSC